MNFTKMAMATLLCTSLISNAEVLHVTSTDQLDSQVLKSGKPAIVKMSAPWCSACTRAKGPYESLATDPQNADVIFVEVDADSSPDIMKKYNVQSLPTFLFIKNGQEVKRSSGFSDNFKKEMNAEITTLKGGAAASMEKKTEELGQTETAEGSGTCANMQDSFLGRAITAVGNFFSSLADTVRGWFR